jgi:uncharacterized membrane protein YdjX (TVP38/TMEM64 family)
MRFRIGLVVAIGAAAALLPRLPFQSVATFLEWVQRFGAGGTVVFGLAFVLAAVLLVPSAVFALGAGFLFGLPLGTVVMSVSSTAGAAAAFLVARRLGRDWVRGHLARQPKAAALGRAVEIDGFRIVLLTRLSPLFPYSVLNYLYGVTGVRFRTFVLASWVGMLPGTVLYVYLGTAAKSLAAILTGGPDPTIAQQALFAAGLVATIAATVLATRTASRALEQVV